MSPFESSRDSDASLPACIAHHYGYSVIHHTVSRKGYKID